MKIYYFILFFIALFFSWGNRPMAQHVNIPDLNFKAALLADNNINTNGDGEIQLTEATAAVEVSVAGNNINDLTGIEAFVNITFLDCSGNNLIY